MKCLLIFLTVCLSFTQQTLAQSDNTEAALIIFGFYQTLQCVELLFLKQAKILELISILNTFYITTEEDLVGLVVTDLGKLNLVDKGSFWKRF